MTIRLSFFRDHFLKDIDLIGLCSLKNSESFSCNSNVFKWQSSNVIQLIKDLPKLKKIVLVRQRFYPGEYLEIMLGLNNRKL